MSKLVTGDSGKQQHFFMRLFTRWKWRGRNGEPYIWYESDSRYAMSRMADTNKYVLIQKHSKMGLLTSL